MMPVLALSPTVGASSRATIGMRCVLWLIRGRLLGGLYDSTQFYPAILPIRNGLAVAMKGRYSLS
jgi:hypothetical protein